MRETDRAKSQDQTSEQGCKDHWHGGSGLPKGQRLHGADDHWPTRLIENGRLGTSSAGLRAPAKTNRSGCFSESTTAPNPPMEIPTMARFWRPVATGNFASTS